MATLNELARWTGAQRPIASESGRISRVSGIADADGESCVFAANTEALEQALASQAGAILASAMLQGERPQADGNPRLLWVADARYSFALVAHRLKDRDSDGGMDATAVVSASAQIGRGTVVGAGAIISDGVRIGERCRIGARACVLQGTLLGDDVVVQAGAILGSDGFGYVRDAKTGEYLAFPQQGTLVLEDRVEVGANSTIDRGALGETRIGRGTKIDNLVHIGHNCRIGQDVVIAAQTGIAGSSVIKDRAVLGGQVGIADHVTIGEGVVLGAQAGVPSGKRLEGSGQVFWGTPARPIEQYLRDLAKLRRL